MMAGPATGAGAAAALDTTVRLSAAAAHWRSRKSTSGPPSGSKQRYAPNKVADQTRDYQTQEDVELRIAWGEALKTTFYEFLPFGIKVVPIYLVEIGLLKRSLSETHAFTVNRMYVINTKKDRAIPPFFQVVLNLLPMGLFAAAALYLMYEEVRQVLTAVDLAVGFLYHTSRCATIGCKYAVVDPDDVEAMYRHDFEARRLSKNLFVAGWGNPRAFHELLAGQIVDAMAATGVNLSALVVTVEPRIAERLNTAKLPALLRDHLAENPPPHVLKEGEVSALLLVSGMIEHTLGRRTNPLLARLAGPLSLLWAFVMPIARACAGLAPFGTTAVQHWAVACYCLGSFLCSNSMLNFNNVARRTWLRRYCYY